MSKKKLNTEDIQSAIDEAIVALALVPERAVLTKAERRRLEVLISDLQDCNRAIPKLARNRKNWSGLRKKAFRLIDRAIAFWLRQFGVGG